MKPSQIVSLALGLLLIVLALFGVLSGLLPTDTTQGLLSVLFAVVLGLFIVASAFSKKDAKAPAQPTQAPPNCPACGRPTAPGYMVCPYCGRPLTTPAPEEPPPPPDQAAPAPAKPPMKKTQTVAIIVVVAIAVSALLVFLFFGSSLLGLGGPVAGDWEGTATYYYLDAFGQRDSVITATCTMDLSQSGNSVSGVLDIYPTQQTDIGEPGYLPAVQEQKEIDGHVNGTRFWFYTESYMAIAGDYLELWEFTVENGHMVGRVTNLDTYAYLGLDSDAGAFVLDK